MTRTLRVQFLVIMVFLVGCGEETTGPQPMTYVVAPDSTGHYPNIQDAIDAARDGDTIELTNGTFVGEGNRDLDFSGKAIYLRSASLDPTLCIIDCQGSSGSPHRAFLFNSNETAETTIEGIGVTGGFAPALEPTPQAPGGAFVCQDGASPMFIGCTFFDNVAPATGGAGFVDAASPSFVRCVFRNNSAQTNGGALSFRNSTSSVVDSCIFENNNDAAIRCFAASPEILNSRFSGNSSRTGGAIYCQDSSSPRIDNCILTRNTATVGGGAIHCFMSSSPEMTNCTVYGNTCSLACIYVSDFSSITISNTIISGNLDGAALFCELNSRIDISCSDVFGNGGGDWINCVAGQDTLSGNLSADPLFCDPQNEGFQIQAASPCAPNVNPECGLIGALSVGC